MKDVDAWLRAGSRCFGLPGARADGNRVVQGSQELSPIEIEPSTAARSLDEPGSDTCRAPGSSGRTRAHREGAPRSFRGRKSSRARLLGASADENRVVRGSWELPRAKIESSGAPGASAARFERVGRPAAALA